MRIVTLVLTLFLSSWFAFADTPQKTPNTKTITKISEGPRSIVYLVTRKNKKFILKQYKKSLPDWQTLLYRDWKGTEILQSFGIPVAKILKINEKAGTLIKEYVGGPTFFQMKQDFERLNLNVDEALEMFKQYEEINQSVRELNSRFSDHHFEFDLKMSQNVIWNRNRWVVIDP